MPKPTHLPDDWQDDDYDQRAAEAWALMEADAFALFDAVNDQPPRRWDDDKG